MSDAKAEKPAKKKGLNLVVILVPIAVIAALVLAFALPPTHALIVKSPLGPLLAKIGLAGSAAKTVAGKTDKPVDPVAEVKRLNLELETGRKAQADKDARIAALQSEVSGLKAPPVVVASPSPLPSPSPTPVSDEVKRTATYWAGMDAEKAADIALRLPQSYVKAVFSQMPADAVADIMSALPAPTAAKLTANVQPGEH